MKVRDYFVQRLGRWVRLHEKGGKEHEVPCHHNLEKYLDEYIAVASSAHDQRPTRPCAAALAPRSKPAFAHSIQLFRKTTVADVDTGITHSTIDECTELGRMRRVVDL
jgi:hypothetical protein